MILLRDQAATEDRRIKRGQEGSVGILPARGVERGALA
jgi:hypothetical protein